MTEPTDARELHRQGFTDEQIAWKLGMATQPITNWSAGAGAEHVTPLRVTQNPDGSVTVHPTGEDPDRRLDHWHRLADERLAEMTRLQQERDTASARQNEQQHTIDYLRGELNRTETERDTLLAQRQDSDRQTSQLTDELRRLREQGSRPDAANTRLVVIDLDDGAVVERVTLALMKVTPSLSFYDRAKRVLNALPGESDG